MWGILAHGTLFHPSIDLLELIQEWPRISGRTRKSGWFMLVVNIHNLENGVLLRCTGRIVAGEEVNILRSVTLAHGDGEEIVLDLANVSTLDGAGIGMLAFLQGRVRSNGIRLRIQNPSHHVRELLELTNLDSVIEVTPSDEFQQICQTLRESESEQARAVAAHR